MNLNKPTPQELKPLNNRQKRFVVEYCKDLSSKQAAIRSGYSSHSAKQIGSENLSKPNILYQIKKQLARTAERTNVTANKVLNEFAKIAFMNVESIQGKCLSEISSDDLACIASITRKTNESSGIVEETIKFHDKLAALDKLGKYLGLFNDKSEPDTKIIVNVQKAPAHIKRPPKRQDT
ncbi:terminase small subunit [Candidatus Latescibacterota bacterium]